MALQQCVRFFAVIVLFFKGYESQSFECGRFELDQAGNHWPWRVFIDVNNDILEGSLITDQWVLTLASSIQNYQTSDLGVYLESVEPLSNPNVYLPLEEITCDPGNELCLLKLADPLHLTDHVQPICLASESSTFYAGTESWITGSSVDDPEDRELEIIGSNECKCFNGPFYKDVICAGREDRESTCLGKLGGALMNKNDSVWVQSGVLSSYDGCSAPSKAGVYVPVSQYKTWITETVTGTPPGFVTFTSPGTDSDSWFTCFTDDTDFTDDTNFSDDTNFTDDTNFSDDTDDQPFIPKCDTVFCGGESLVHFAHFTTLCVLVVLLHVFVGSC